ncbi:DMT family transporter, partial [Marinobacter sp.]|uniref:DMT family transporter n=1 Tax=Marinobacter sp. TaxID=50741 RepID=UPI0035C702EB
LLLAGLLEIGWPVGLKLAQAPGTRITGIVVAIAFMAASGTLLFLAQRQIPIGTAYAVWTGIGAAGTFLVGYTVAFVVPMVGGLLADWTGDARHALLTMIAYAILALPLAFTLNLERKKGQPES